MKKKGMETWFAYHVVVFSPAWNVFIFREIEKEFVCASATFWQIKGDEF